MIGVMYSVTEMISGFTEHSHYVISGQMQNSSIFTGTVSFIMDLPRLVMLAIKGIKYTGKLSNSFKNRHNTCFIR